MARVFIIENETSFLEFPCAPKSIAVFGAGYGFAALRDCDWLHRCEVHYWGDIDTHGFAILDQLRAHFPHVRSQLMARATLLEHRSSWGTEPSPETRELPRLNDAERDLYDDLRDQRLGRNLRLEQEFVGFRWLQQALNEMAPEPEV